MTSKILFFVSLFFITLVALIADAIPYSLEKPISPEFKPYIIDFIIRSNGKVRPEAFQDLTIHFNQLAYSQNGTGVIGFCSYTFKGDGFYSDSIEIDSRFWRESSDIEKWALMFHEFGHCICKRDHPQVDEESFFIKLLNKLDIIHHRSAYMSEDGCPTTIMHPNTATMGCLLKHQGHYIQELFSKCH